AVHVAESINTRLKRKQSSNVSRERWQLNDRQAANRVPNGRISRIHLNRFRRYGNRLRDRAHFFERHVDGCRCVYTKFNIVNDYFGEACGLRAEPIRPWLDLWKAVSAFGIRYVFSPHAAVGVFERECCVRNHRPGWVGYGAAQLRQLLAKSRPRRKQ